MPENHVIYQSLFTIHRIRALMSYYMPNTWAFFGFKALFETFYAIWRDISMS